MPFLKKTGCLILGAIFALSLPCQMQAHEDDFKISYVKKDRDVSQRIVLSRQVDVLPAERQAGIVNLSEVLPILRNLNQQSDVFKNNDFRHFVENFHYPFRDRFFLNEQKPPSQVILHWTANKRYDNPLITFSAFLRSFSRGRVVERANKYKNVSNYFLTGTLRDQYGNDEAYLLKLTRGNLRSWGDIPRVTAYPTGDSWDDNKYDGRGAIGIEIDSPDFGTFYRNPQQRRKLMDFLRLVLEERGVSQEFLALRRSRHWEDMVKLHRYLRDNVEAIDVNERGNIPQDYQRLDRMLTFLPDINRGVYQEAQKMFQYISGHAIVAREYNERMIRSGRNHDAAYHKIDFTEPHVFVVAMDLLQAGLEPTDDLSHYDLATQEYIRQQRKAKHRASISMTIPESAEHPGEFDHQLLDDSETAHFPATHVVDWPEN